MALIWRNKLLQPCFQVYNRAFSSIIHKLADQDRNFELEKQETSFDKENCILVDENDRNIGSASKRDCHRVDGNDIKLHRAFSVFLFNKDGDMLIQKRSSLKVNLVEIVV